MYQASSSIMHSALFQTGIDAKVSSVSAPFTRFLSWKAPEEAGLMTDLQVMTKHMFDKRVLLNLIRYCTVFEAEEKKDETTGLVSISKIKKVAAYHQYYAVQKAVHQTLRATSSEDGDRKVGVVLAYPRKWEVIINGFL